MSSSAVLDDGDQQSTSSLMRNSGRGSPGQAHIDPAGTRVAIMLDWPAELAVADLQGAVVSLAPPALKCGHARLEWDINDPLER